MTGNDEGSVPKVSMRRRLSFWLSVAIIAILAAILLSSLDDASVQGERAAVKQVLNQVHGAIVLKNASLQLPNAKVKAAQLAGHNPLNWIDFKYADYSDSCGANHRPANGHWCFQHLSGSNGVLAYRSRHLAGIQGQPADSSGLFRWRVDVDTTSSGPSRLVLKRWWPHKKQP